MVVTKTFRKEIHSICNYISNILFSPYAENKLIESVAQVIEDVRYMPRRYKVIKKYDSINAEYRSIRIKNYVIIYTISEIDKTVYFVHIYYGRSNYLFKF